MPIIPCIIKVYNFVKIHIMHGCWMDCTSRQKHKLVVFVFIYSKPVLTSHHWGMAYYLLNTG